MPSDAKTQIRVLLTGGAGFVGSHLAKHLLDKGHEVFVLDGAQHCLATQTSTFAENMTYRREVLLKGAVIEWTGTHSQKAVRRFVEDAKPECVVHLGSLAIPGVALRQPEEAFHSIMGGTVSLLESLRDSPTVKRVVYISSSMIYGDFTQRPMTEAGEKNPKEIYGALKLASELYVKAFSKQYGLPYAIVRPCAAYGPGDNNRRVLQIFLENAIQGKPIVAKNPSQTFLDFTYVTDLAAGLALVATCPQGLYQEFNITRGEERSLQDAINIIKTFFPDLRDEIDSDPTDYRPSRGTLDIAQARTLLGYQPECSLDCGIERYLRYMLEHNPSLKAGFITPSSIGYR